MTDDTYSIKMADGNGELMLAHWPSGTEYETAMTANEFSKQLTIGADPDVSYCTIELWKRHDGICVIDINDVNGWVSVAARSLTEALDLCARWSALVSASALAHWADDLRSFMLHQMPSGDEVERERRGRAEVDARRRAEVRAGKAGRQ